MKPDSGEILTSIVLVSIVFALFTLAAVLRMKSSWIAVHNATSSRRTRLLRTLDFGFSGVFLVASIGFYTIFLMNAGN